MKKLMILPMAALVLSACSDPMSPDDQSPAFARIASLNPTHVTVALSAAPYVMCTVGGNVRVSGSVTVTNTGANSSADLVVLAMIQGKNPPGVTAFENAALAASLATGEIAAGQTVVYPFSIEFDAAPYTEFRMRATANISNQSTGGPAYPRQNNSDGFVIPQDLLACGGTIAPRGIGYWKNHEAETTGLLSIDLGVEVVATFARADAILDMAQGNAWNGIEKLMAQLLAAKLNQDAGACGFATVTSIADAAATFLSTNGPSSWGSLTGAQKDAVEAWKDALDTYNNSTCS